MQPSPVRCMPELAGLRIPAIDHQVEVRVLLVFMPDNEAVVMADAKLLSDPNCDLVHAITRKQGCVLRAKADREVVYGAFTLTRYVRESAHVSRGFIGIVGHEIDPIRERGPAQFGISLILGEIICENPSTPRDGTKSNHEAIGAVVDRTASIARISCGGWGGNTAPSM